MDFAIRAGFYPHSVDFVGFSDTCHSCMANPPLRTAPVRGTPSRDMYRTTSRCLGVGLRFSMYVSHNL